MPKVRAGVSEKWARVTPGRVEDYRNGVENPRRDWKTATVAAAKNQAIGAQKAIAEHRFEKGVEKAGTAKWQSKAVEKGTQRFGPGVQAAQQDYATAIAPYLAVIESTTLPPRFPKGDPRNLLRVTAMAEALRKKKLSG